MTHQQIEQAIQRADEQADPVLIEIAKELRDLTCFPHKRIRILALMHHFAAEVARCALTEQQPQES